MVFTRAPGIFWGHVDHKIKKLQLDKKIKSRRIAVPEDDYSYNDLLN